MAYMLMTRLGLRADDYFSPDEFAHVYEFNTPPTINALGIATSDIAEMGLREISRTVMQAQRDQFFANREKSRYGTKRINAYEIIEDTLNLKDVRIFDYVYDADGRKTAVLNKKETAIAQSKQELIKDAFAEWIWKDPDRREAICKTYNILFNSNRPREYDGSHINFSGMNPEITLRKHQVNAIAHILYGGNTLLAHVVGAGKTFEMVAAAMESKRLGL